MGSRKAAAVKEIMLTHDEIEYIGTLIAHQLREAEQAVSEAAYMRRIRTTYRCSSGFR